jgi:hypothetical protein
MGLLSPKSSPKPGGRELDSDIPSGMSYGGSSESGISGIPSTLDSQMYEEVGPASRASTGTEGSDSNYVERKDKSGNVLVNEKGVPIKWRIKKRAGHRRKKRINSLKATEDAEEEDVFDSRMGDADDRINDVDHLLTTGEDVDFKDDEYVTNYVVVKKKKSVFHRLMPCIFKKKRRKYQ